ncbi:MAG: hypothetical protein KGZ62_09805 [Sulfurimonas sp.]|nr:hypothetical protein [Sulfurimonas sp.]
MTFITVLTSISPRNLEVQQHSIANWLSLGFNVISVNSQAEINAVSDSFPKVNFVSVERTAAVIAGKPYVYLDDIVSTLLSVDSEIYGIVNSDIWFNLNHDGITFLAKMAREGLLFGSRVDVKSLSTLDGEVYIYGFDFFFSDKYHFSKLPQSSFCLGVPWWDYWLPLALLCQGVSCREMVSPVAFHLWHENQWNPQLFNIFGKSLIGKLDEIFDNTITSEHLLMALNQVKNDGNYSQFSYSVLYEIWAKSNQVTTDTQCMEDDSRSLTNKIHLRSLRRSLYAKLCAAEIQNAELAKLRRDIIQSKFNKIPYIRALAARIKLLLSKIHCRNI